jgi:glycosyltransferase involved in cell wall biosynthesis
VTSSPYQALPVGTATSILKVSVVIPTYNRASLIGETLAAIFAQTLLANEVIVVDDGSTDDIQAALAAYGDRIRIIRIENGGELVARNVGLRASSGELVAFCDSDDLWRPNFLVEMAAQWAATPSLIACYSDFLILRDGISEPKSKFTAAPLSFWENIRQTTLNGFVFENPFLERLLDFQPFFPSCMMVSRKRFLAIGGWDEGVSRLVGCDFATTLRVAGVAPIGVVRMPMVSIRKHAGNFSGDTERMNLGDAKVLDYIIATRPELSMHRKAMIASIGVRRADAMDSAFSRRDFGAVRDIYRLLLPDQKSKKRRIKHMLSMGG